MKIIDVPATVLKLLALQDGDLVLLCQITAQPCPAGVGWV
jgi:hypothetical protein